jgi:hypothetical protein
LNKRTFEDKILSYFNIKMECRSCTNLFDPDEQIKGVFWIPLIDQYFKLSEINKIFDPSKTLFYCTECFQNMALKRISRYKCANCHVYDSYNGAIPTVNHNLTKISGNCCIGEFIVVDKLPDFLKPRDHICIPCLILFKEVGLIKRIKGTYSDPLTALRKRNPYSKEKFVPDEDEVDLNIKSSYSHDIICDICLQPCINESSNYNNDQDDTSEDTSDDTSDQNMSEIAPEISTDHDNSSDENVSGIAPEISTDHDNSSDENVSGIAPEVSNDNDNDKENFTVKIPASAVKSWARFHSPTLFYYGMGGAFQTKGPVSFNTNNVDNWIVCDDCLKNIEYEPYKSIKCGLCNESFTALFDEGDQGDGCASSITEKGIYCHYGSCKDEDKFTWTDGIMPKEFRNIKNICDTCIDKLVEKKVIEYQGESNSWVLGGEL